MCQLQTTSQRYSFALSLIAFLILGFDVHAHYNGDDRENRQIGECTNNFIRDDRFTSSLHEKAFVSGSDVYFGHNERLIRIIYQENPQANGPVNSISGKRESIDWYVRSLRFLNGLWWHRIGTISAKTSRSTVLSDYGEGSYRQIYWPKGRGHEANSNYIPDLSRLRISAIFNSEHIMVAIEVFAKDERGEWQPFKYVRTGDEFLPQKTIKGFPVRDFCFRCHSTPSGELTPLPFSVKSKDDLEAIGYSLSQKEAVALLSYKKFKRPWYKF